ncbi:conditioned medium-induced protein 4 [Halobellus salinisoli]|uniref:conditioned medium-induced protein 4 n=1 Tax=Halobellus salinisoli TaxID=3108500 RepID=UPI0030085AE2
MDEKTAELRDLFVEATGEDAVTESQSTPRGSLERDLDDEAVDDRLDELIETMRERDDFSSSLSTPALRRVVRAFFDPDAAGADSETWSAAADAALASSLPSESEPEAAAIDAEDVFRARMDLHLVSDADREGPIPYETLRRHVLDAVDDDVGSSAVDNETLAAELSEAADADVALETARRYRRVVESDIASRRVNHRFRDAFADLLTDADLSTRLAEDARRDGLREATEDIETDVSL